MCTMIPKYYRQLAYKTRNLPAKILAFIFSAKLRFQTKPNLMIANDDVTNGVAINLKLGSVQVISNPFWTTIIMTTIEDLKPSWFGIWWPRQVINFGKGKKMGGVISALYELS